MCVSFSVYLSVCADEILPLVCELNAKTIQYTASAVSTW